MRWPCAGALESRQLVRFDVVVYTRSHVERQDVPVSLLGGIGACFRKDRIPGTMKRGSDSTVSSRVRSSGGLSCRWSLRNLANSSGLML